MPPSLRTDTDLRRIKGSAMSLAETTDTRDEDLTQSQLEKVAPYFSIHHDMDLSLDQVAEKTLIGTPEEIVERLRRFLEIGVNHFIVKHLPFNQEVESVRLFSREVIPALRAEGEIG